MTNGTLVVTAHPETTSFTFALRERTLARVAACGAPTQSSDLYQAGFSAAAGRGDLAAYPVDRPFQLATAQREAAQWGGLVPELAAEQAKLRAVDTVVLHFPWWWGGCPALLKGWIERVLSYGFAYGRGATLAPRQYLLCVSTGSGGDAAADAQDRADIERWGQQVFGYMGWQALPAFVAHGPAQRSAPERANLLADYARHLDHCLAPRPTPIP